MTRFSEMHDHGYRDHGPEEEEEVEVWLCADCDSAVWEDVEAYMPDFQR